MQTYLVQSFPFTILRRGVKTRCPVTTTTAETTWRTIGIIIGQLHTPPESWQQNSHQVTWSSGVIVFLLIVYVCVIFHKEIKAFFSRMRITKGVNQQASPRAGTIPLYHDKGTSADPHQKEGGVVAESEVHPPKVATSTQARANSLTATPVAPAQP